MMFNLSDSDLMRFWAKVALPDDNGCMLWTAGSSSCGYGAFKVGGKMYAAHRLSLWLAVGPPPEDRPEAAHGCRRPRCVAPDHLRWATRVENLEDRDRHGTTARGELTAAAKLTAAQVRDLRARYAQGGVSQRALAAEFGVHQAQVYRIVSGKSWRQEVTS